MHIPLRIFTTTQIHTHNIMKRIFNIACLLMLLAMAIPARADKPFYDSKSWVVNVAGDPDFLKNVGFESKVNGITSFNVPFSIHGVPPTKAECERLAEEMTQAGIGKKFIDALTGHGHDDSYLKKLALWNANQNDIEFAADHLRGEGADGMETLIADDYEPILRQNYIVLTDVACTTDKNGKKTCVYGYAIFQVMVDKDEAFDIVMNLGTDKYDQLNFPVKFLYANKCIGADTAEKDIAKHVPGLAVRGVLTRRHPARISIGEDKGIHKGDLVSIYSQRADKNGNLYSKRISRARVCGVWDHEAQINFEAGTRGNRKNGDIVVRTPDSHFRWGLMATYTPHVWGGQVLMDMKTGFTRAGIIHHMLMDLGFSMTDHPDDNFTVVAGDKAGHEYKAPMFANFGIGYGLSKTFVGFFDVMPFFLIQYEAGMMFDNTTFDTDDSNSKSILGSSIRVPIGVRFSFNIGYPLRLALEAGYSPAFGFGDDHKIVKQTCDIMGAKRNSVFVNLGLTF